MGQKLGHHHSDIYVTDNFKDVNPFLLFLLAGFSHTVFILFSESNTNMYIIKYFVSVLTRPWTLTLVNLCCSDTITIGDYDTSCWMSAVKYFQINRKQDTVLKTVFCSFQSSHGKFEVSSIQWIQQYPSVSVTWVAVMVSTEVNHQVCCVHMKLSLCSMHIVLRSTSFYTKPFLTQRTLFSCIYFVLIFL